MFPSPGDKGAQVAGSHGEGLLFLLENRKEGLATTSAQWFPWQFKAVRLTKAAYQEHMEKWGSSPPLKNSVLLSLYF